MKQEKVPGKDVDSAEGLSQPDATDISAARTPTESVHLESRAPGFSSLSSTWPLAANHLLGGL